MLFKITNGSVSLGSETVLENINIEINAGEKIAVVGRNGAGKTTLLKCITGEAEMEEGTGEEKFSVAKVGNPVIGYLKQIAFEDESASLLDEVLKSFMALLDMEDRISHLHKCIEKSPDERTIREFTALSERFELSGGYTYKKEYSVMIKQFGFTEEDKQRPISDFSGGQRTKIAFIKLLLSHPDILLLDEPTNHLDISTVRWLENYIKNYKSAAVIVSHDRMFLEHTAQKVYEIEYGETHRYKGNYSDFEKQKKDKYEKELKDFEYRRKEKDRLTKLVERFRYKATKAAMAQSKLKQIQRLETGDRPDRYDLKSFHSSFQPDRESVKKVLELRKLGVGYDKALAEITFTLERGQRLGVIGDNGTGKSTFLKTIMGELKPLSGEYEFGLKTQTGYFDQQMAHYKSHKTVKDDFHDEFPELTETEVRTSLGSFLFSGEDVFKCVNDLSGGERVRLALCKIFKRRPNVLILDEPTNHMDIVGKETLENMLKAYSGTIIVVSHDRYLINKIADRLLVFDGNGASFLPYGYEEFEERENAGQESLLLDACSSDKAPSETVTVSGKDVDGKSGKEAFMDFKNRGKIEKRIKKLEELMDECHEEIETLNKSLEDPDIASDYARLGEIQEKIDEVKLRQEEYSEEWMELSEELEEQ